MTGEQPPRVDEHGLTAAEVRQRRDAPVKHGGFSSHSVPESRTTYRRLLRRVSRAGLRTDPVLRMRLELLARVLVPIERVDRWLAQQPDSVFGSDGGVHGILPHYFEWIRTASRILDKVPSEVEVVIEEDLSVIAAKARRG